MKFLFVVLVLLVPVSVFARGDGGSGKISVGGFYGMASISPTDLNDYSAAIPSTPALSKINTATFYGGTVGFMFSPRVGMHVGYEALTAKNTVDTNITANNGFKIDESDVTGTLDFYLVSNGNVYVYLGGGAVYPTTFKGTMNLGGTPTDGTADKKVGFKGEAGVGFMFGNHFSLFFEGSYVSLKSGDFKDSSGTALPTLSGSGNAVVDLSGPRAEVGVAFHF